MNFFGVNAGSSQFDELAISSDFWIPWAMSVPITLLTVLTWYVWQAQQLKQGTKRKIHKFMQFAIGRSISTSASCHVHSGVSAYARFMLWAPSASSYGAS